MTLAIGSSCLPVCTRHFSSVEKVATIYDLHATILHLLGLDHEALTYNYAGRDFRLTNVSGKVAEKILL